MKYFLNKIIVVEGKEDCSYLSSFIEAEYVTTNGYQIPSEEIDYINEASKYKEILILVDPDKAGLMIEDKLKKLIKSATYLHIDIASCNRGKKNGVAESEKEEIIKVLKPYFSEKEAENDGVFNGKLIKMRLNDKELREHLCKKYHMGKCTSKKFIQRAKTLQLNEAKIEEEINRYYGD